MGKRLPILIFCLVFFTHVYTFGHTGWDMDSRLNVLHAIVYEHRIEIDTFHANSMCKVLLNGHYYSEKAPGVVLVALPAFLLSAHVVKALGLNYLGSLAWQISAWITTAGSAGLMAAIAAVAMFAMLRRSVSAHSAAVVTLTFFFATTLFTYATILYAHTIAASFLCLALWALSSRAHRDVSKDIFIGFCGGMAVCSEYPAFIATVGLFAYILFRSRVQALYFVLGSLPPLLVILLNNYWMSGSPLMFGYNWGHQMTVAQTAHLGSPNILYILKLLVLEHRGLFFWSPFLLLLLVGYRDWYKKQRILAIITAICAVALVLYVSGLGPDWHGGWALGPRHFTSILPFLALPVAFGFQRYPRAGYLLAALSFLLTFLAALSDPQTPENFIHPFFEFYLPRYGTGQFGNNLAMLFGFSSFTGLVLLLTALGFGFTLAYRWSGTRTAAASL